MQSNVVDNIGEISVGTKDNKDTDLKSSPAMIMSGAGKPIIDNYQDISRNNINSQLMQLINSDGTNAIPKENKDLSITNVTSKIESLTFDDQKNTDLVVERQTESSHTSSQLTEEEEK